MRRTLETLALTGCLWLMSCQEGAVSLHYHEERPSPPPSVVIVESGHVCTPACAHYWDGGRYVVVTRGHRHGPGCGHVLDSGHWVVAVSGTGGGAVVTHGGRPASAPVVRAVRVPPPPGPANLYVYSRSGSKWQKIKVGHVHGPGCGHVVYEGYWCID